MSAAEAWTIHTDGAARGNPGPAAFAFTIDRPGHPAVEDKGRLPDTTNNVAEYTALVKALERAGELGGKHLVVNSDSELMVKQMAGEYRVKNEGLRPLFEKASALAKAFASVEYRHVPRKQNKRTDALCNQALDESSASLVPPRASAVRHHSAGPGADLPAGAREDVLECLRSAACAWSAGNPNVPRAEEVWEQIWSIVAEAGVLRKASQ
jgi:ribonuclease HI